MSQPQPEWVKKLLDWLSRQPRWVLVVGVVVLLAAGAWLMSDLGSPAAQAIPGTAPTDPSLNSTALALGVFLRLILVVAAVYFVALVVRRWQSNVLKRPERKLVLLESLHLSSRRAVHLIQAGEQVFLVGATDQSINLLGKINVEEDVNVSFAQQLAMASQKDQGAASE